MRVAAVPVVVVAAVALALVAGVAQALPAGPGFQPYSRSDTGPHGGCLGYCRTTYGAWGVDGCDAPSAETTTKCACAAGCGCAEPAVTCAQFCMPANGGEYASALSSAASVFGAVQSGYFDANGQVGTTLVNSLQISACLDGCRNRGACNGAPLTPPAPAAGQCWGGVYPAATDYNVTNCATIVGDLQLVGGTDTNLTFPFLTSVTGFVHVSNTALTALYLPALTEVTGGLRFASNPQLNVIYAPQLTAVRGYLAFNDLPALTNLTGFPALSVVSAGLSLENLPALRDLSDATGAFPALVAPFEQLTVKGVASPFGLTKPQWQPRGFEIAVHSAALTFATTTSDGRMAYAALTVADGGSVQLTGFANTYHLENLKLDVGAGATLVVNAFQALDNVTNAVTLRGVPQATGLAWLANLRWVTTLRVVGTGSGAPGADLTSLQPLCALTHLDFLHVAALGQLTAVNGNCLSRITALKGLVVRDCPALTTLDWFAAVTTVTGSVTLGPNLPLLRSHSAFERLRRIRSGGLTITGAPLLSNNTFGSLYGGSATTGQRVVLDALNVSIPFANPLSAVSAVGSLQQLVFARATDLHPLFQLRNVTAQDPTATVTVGGPNLASVAGLCRVPWWTPATLVVQIGEHMCARDVRRQFTPRLGAGTSLSVVGGDGTCERGMACSCSNLTSVGLAPCMNGGMCVETDGVGHACACPSGFGGLYCDRPCAAGFTGPQCTVDVDECASMPCMNGGNCTDLVNGYSCLCPNATFPPQCASQGLQCASNPCLNGATCTETLTAWTCQCPGGFSGDRCQVNQNECASAPCLNGGSCDDRAGHFYCDCPAAFQGVVCQFPADPCTPNPCPGGQTCSIGVRGFICTASSGARTAPPAAAWATVAVTALLAAFLAGAGRL